MRSTFRLLCAMAAFGAAALSVRAEDGPALFRQHCASCHGADGKAQTPAAKKLGVRDLTQSKLGEPEIRTKVSEGVKNARGQQVMTAFAERLSDEEIKALVAFAKVLQSKP